MDRGEGGKREQRKRQNIVKRRKKQYGMIGYGKRKGTKGLYTEERNVVESGCWEWNAEKKVEASSRPRGRSEQFRVADRGRMRRGR